LNSLATASDIRHALYLYLAFRRKRPPARRSRHRSTGKRRRNRRHRKRQASIIDRRAGAMPPLEARHFQPAAPERVSDTELCAIAVYRNNDEVD